MKKATTKTNQQQPNKSYLTQKSDTSASNVYESISDGETYYNVQLSPNNPQLESLYSNENDYLQPNRTNPGTATNREYEGINKQQFVEDSYLHTTFTEDKNEPNNLEQLPYGKQKTSPRNLIFITVIGVLLVGFVISNILFIYWYVQDNSSTANETVSYSQTGEVNSSHSQSKTLSDPAKQHFRITTDLLTKSQACGGRLSRLIDINDMNSNQMNEVMNTLLDVPPSLRDVAKSTQNASCSASSEYSATYSCQKAIDGDNTPATSEWVIRTSGTAIGSWIRIDFPVLYEVSEVQILTRCEKNYQNKGFMLIFSDGTETHGELDCFNGTSRSDCGNAYWQNFPVTSRVTSYVKIQITSACGNKYNGFREVRVDGRPVSSYWIKKGTQRGDSCWAANRWGVFRAICNNQQQRFAICKK